MKKIQLVKSPQPVNHFRPTLRPWYMNNIFENKQIHRIDTLAQEV